MDETQIFFKKVRMRLKKYWFNWTTQKVEDDEFIDSEHVDHIDTMSDDKRKLFKMRGSAVVVCTFLVLAGAGVVDAQTRAYEIIYKGTSIGCVDNLKVVKLAVSDTNSGKSGRRNRRGMDYEIRPARATEFLTTEEVAKEIVEIRSQEKISVAKMDRVQQLGDQTVDEVPVTDVMPIQTTVATASATEEPQKSAANYEENPTAVISVSETPTAVTSEVEKPVIEVPVAETPAEDDSVIEGPTIK